MANRNLTYREWENLSEYERGEQYKNLSDDDKFHVRITMDTGSKKVLCCDCRHYHMFEDLKSRCAAYPDGIPKAHVDAIIKDINTPCDQGYRFEAISPEEKSVRDQLSAELAERVFEKVFGSGKE